MDDYINQLVNKDNKNKHEKFLEKIIENESLVAVEKKDLENIEDTYRLAEKLAATHGNRYTHRQLKCHQVMQKPDYFIALLCTDSYSEINFYEPVGNSLLGDGKSMFKHVNIKKADFDFRWDLPKKAVLANAWCVDEGEKIKVMYDWLKPHKYTSDSDYHLHCTVMNKKDYKIEEEPVTGMQKRFYEKLFHQGEPMHASMAAQMIHENKELMDLLEQMPYRGYKEAVEALAEVPDKYKLKIANTLKDAPVSEMDALANLFKENAGKPETLDHILDEINEAYNDCAEYEQKVFGKRLKKIQAKTTRGD